MANVITITALNRYVKELLERDAVLTDVALRGEISNFTNHYKTGHFYFSLKDEACSVKAVMFRSAASQLPFMPQNGMRVIVHCRISLFERDGAFQIYVEEMIPDGVGAMQLAFDQLKEKLAREGLFDAAHKRSLPPIPRCVGLVTSKTGAAMQDILQVTRRRNPAAHLLLYPVTVQGNEAAPGIVRAIETLSESGLVDVIIVARGGGSKEDLWVFNHEQIARAAYASRVPVVSAIGHEIDFCILDFAADLRAPTPSAAAELVMPDLAQRLRDAHKTFGNIRKTLQNKLDLCYNETMYRRSHPLLKKTRERPDVLRTQLVAQKAQAVQAMQAKLDSARRESMRRAQVAASLNPYAVLARGYAVVQTGSAVVRDSSAVQPGDTVSVRLLHGALRCTIDACLTQAEYGDQE